MALSGGFGKSVPLDSAHYVGRGSLVMGSLGHMPMYVYTCIRSRMIHCNITISVLYTNLQGGLCDNPVPQGRVGRRVSCKRV